MLIGTKVDLESDRKVPYEEVLQYATDENCLFTETSALHDVNMQSTFKKLMEEAYRRSKHKSENTKHLNNITTSIKPKIRDKRKVYKSCIIN